MIPCYDMMAYSLKFLCDADVLQRWLVCCKDNRRYLATYDLKGSCLIWEAVKHPKLRYNEVWGSDHFYIDFDTLKKCHIRKLKIQFEHECKLKPGDIPYGVEELTIDYYNRELFPRDVIPSSVTRLGYYGYKLWLDFIPPSVKRLDYSGTLDDWFPNIPDTVTEIGVQSVKYVLDKQFTPHIKVLHVNGLFDNIEDMFPTWIEELHIGMSSVDVRVDKFPPNVKRIFLGGKELFRTPKDEDEERPTKHIRVE
jgi:hypothetical protein